MIFWRPNGDEVAGYQPDGIPFKDIWGGGLSPLVNVSPNLWPLVEVFFSQKWVFFETFEIYLPTPPQNSLFIAFLLTNFPKIPKKRSKISNKRGKLKKVLKEKNLHPKFSMS